MPDYRVIGVEGLPEVRPGDDVAALVAGAIRLQDGDVVVVTSKVLSKAEGRLVSVPEGRTGRPRGSGRSRTRPYASWPVAAPP